MSAFVGRADELHDLEALIALPEDAPAAAVIVGDPGCGKTRLLAETVERIDLGRLAQIVGYEPERNVPLSASAELLQALTAAPAGLRLNSLVFGSESSGFEPMRIFEAAHQAVDDVEPVLLLVDDLQWIDELSLALCHYLVRAAEASGQRLALIAASRPSAQTSSFVASLAQLLPPERFVSRDLGPLSDHESLELIAALAPNLARTAATAVSEMAGGSPFWLEALVRTSGAELDAARLVTDRLRGAGADAGMLLALLAVAARPLTLADAARLQGWTAERVEHAATELVSRGVAAQTSGGVRLAHDVTRNAAFRDLPAETRRDMQRRLAEWLEEIAGDDVRWLREALEHRHEAGLPSLELAGRLARAPRRTLLGEEGLTLLARIADEADPGESETMAVDEAVAALAGDLANHQTALAHWSRVAEHATGAMRRAAALLAASRAAFSLGDEAGARTYLDRSLALGIADEVFELEQAAQEAAIGLWSGEDRAAGRAQARKVAQRADQLVDEAGGVEALTTRARRAYLEALRVEYEAAYQDDDLDALRQASAERAAVARGFDDEAYLTASIDNARALRRSGRLGESEQRLCHAWQAAHRRVLPQRTIDAGYWLATVLEQQGRIVEAEDVVTEAIELAARVGDEARARHPISRLGHKIAFHRGEWRRAVAAFLEDGRAAGTHGRIEYHQDAAVWLAFAGGGDAEAEVIVQVDEARKCADAAGCPCCKTELQLATAEALVRVGHNAEAASSLAEWERLQPRPQPRDRVLQRRTQDLLSARDGNGAATSLLEGAVDEAEQLGFVLEALWTRIDLGRLLATVDRDPGLDVLRQAAATAVDLGALTEEQVAEKNLRALGVRTWRRGAVTGQLTEREREIARLVAEGASNPEIAQELFLSRKTVERHVSNLLKKAGVRNRAELAAKATELAGEGVPR